MTIHQNKPQSSFDPAFPFKPGEKAVDRPGRDARFANTLTGFADWLAQGRRVLRDSYYDVGMRRRRTAPAEAAHFSAWEWTMIVTAGIALGVVLTLMLAGT